MQSGKPKEKHAGHDPFLSDTPTFDPGIGIATVPGSGSDPIGPTNPSSLVLSQPKPDSNEENTFKVPDMGEKDTTALLSLLVNGYPVQSLKDPVPDEPGPYRYLRADGVNECRVFGVAGQYGGHPVQALTHMSSHAYSKEQGVKTFVDPATGKPHRQVHPSLEAYTALCEKLQENHGTIRQIGATQRYPDDGRALIRQRDDLPRNVHVTPNRGRSTDYLLDATDFDLHVAGPTDELTGSTAVGESVTASETLAQLDREYALGATARAKAAAKAMKRAQLGNPELMKRHCEIL
jgi:hypothetical protein